MIRAIVGLGNPGAEYERTRHNVGFLILKELAGRGATWQSSDLAMEAEAELGGQQRLLFCPQTYMNRSGLAVRAMQQKYGWGADQILVVYDDIDLVASRIRIRRSGGAGTHRGVASVLEQLETEEFPRVRVGVGGAPDGMPLDRFVLEPLAGEAWELFSRVVTRGAEATRAICDEGIGVGMNRFNSMAPLDGAVGQSGESESDSNTGGTI